MLELIELNDRNGSPIHVGDKVVFHFDEFLGYSDEPHDDYTTMNDIVIKEDEKFYFLDQDIGSAAFAWRHNKHCTIVTEFMNDEPQKEPDLNNEYSM